MTHYNETTPTGAGVYAQRNWSHPLVTPSILYFDDYIVMQMVSGPGSVEVTLLHALSHYTPRQEVLSAFAVAIQWVRYNAHDINLTAHFVRIHSSGISHDWMRKHLVEQMDFVAVPMPSGAFIFQYELRQKGADNA